MMKFLCVSVVLWSIIFSLVHPPCSARVLEIGPGAPYARLSEAAAEAQPGDTLMFLAGTHQGGDFVQNLHGTQAQDGMITITGAPQMTSRIVGGSNAFQLSDVSYVRITHLEFEGQTGNGLNIDDGGTLDTPSENIIIEHCNWLGMNASGNNDELKLSGVDNFHIRWCNFRNGAEGGSMIDMVGCHHGTIFGNTFMNAGSNCIQVKGGSRFIVIRQCLFENGGQRTLNIGGSTGLAYFRPQDANSEASDVMVHSNVLIGSTASVAFVGAVQCTVMNNTIFLPEKWAVRILQENTDARFERCGNNDFYNNIIYIDSRAAAPTLNVGPDTEAASFYFGYNLWFNTENPHWNGPDLPSPEEHGVVGLDPDFVDPGSHVLKLRPASPAIGFGGGKTHGRLQDFEFLYFNEPPSVGAYEGNPVSGVARPTLPGELHVSVFPNPSRGRGTATLIARARGAYCLEIVDLLGRVLKRDQYDLDAGTHTLPLSLEGTESGSFLVRITGPRGRSTSALFILVQ